MTFWSEVALPTAGPLGRLIWLEIVLAYVHENIHFVGMKTLFSTVIQNIHLFEEFFDLKPSAPFGGKLFLTVSSAPGANLWRVETLSALWRLAPFIVQLRAWR